MPAFRLEDRLSYQCSLISTRISRFITPALEERFGLTLIMWRVLAVIGRHEPLSSKDVAQHTSTDAYFVSRAVEQLARKKLISRTPSVHDRRRSCLQLTDEGRKTHQEVEAFINRVEAAWVRDLPSGTRDTLRQMLVTLNECSQSLVANRHWQEFLQPEEEPAGQNSTS